VHAEHTPELPAAARRVPPAPATRHLLRVGPTIKAVGWVLSRRFLARLLAAQRAQPFMGPVDVWAWRVVDAAGGGAVRAYAPRLPWIEEDGGCTSHHDASDGGGAAAHVVPAAPAAFEACPVDRLPHVVLDACQRLGLRDGPNT
jgi:hypothetical protein